MSNQQTHSKISADQTTQVLARTQQLCQSLHDNIEDEKEMMFLIAANLANMLIHKCGGLKGALAYIQQVEDYNTSKDSASQNPDPKKQN